MCNVLFFYNVMRYCLDFYFISDNSFCEFFFITLQFKFYLCSDGSSDKLGNISQFESFYILIINLQNNITFFKFGFGRRRIFYNINYNSPPSYIRNINTYSINFCVYIDILVFKVIRIHKSCIRIIKTLKH